MPDIASRHLRVFLCHSSGDKPTVRELYQRLKDETWIDAWLDEEKLLAGQDWEYEIEAALDNSDAVIVILSTDSVSKEGYVQKELRFAMDIALEKPEGTIYILPLRLDDCVRPRKLRHLHTIDYFPPGNREKGYARLRASLEKKASKLGILTEGFQSKQETPKAPTKKPKTKRMPRTSSGESKLQAPRSYTTGKSEPQSIAETQGNNLQEIKSKPNAKTNKDEYTTIRFGDILFEKVPAGMSPNGVAVPYEYYITLFNYVAPEYVKKFGNLDHKFWNVSDLNQAKAYCQWVHERMKGDGILPAGMVVRLPRKAEYKKAVEMYQLRVSPGKPWLYEDVQTPIHLAIRNLFAEDVIRSICLVIAPDSS